MGAIAAGLGAIAGTVARADTTVDTKFLWYSESGGRTKVLNPAVSVEQTVGEKGLFGLQLAYDTISGASPTGEAPTLDAMASASSAGNIPLADYKDTRRAIGASYSQRFGSHLPSIDLSYSRENDYLSRGLSLVDSWDLNGGRSTFHFGAGLTRDRIDPVGLTESFKKDSFSLAAGWTQVIGPRDLVDVSLGLTDFSGYLTDPYKRVTVAGVSAPENRPDSRSRKTFVVKYGHYFMVHSALKTTYRYYWDDWSVKAHTLEFSYDQHIGERLIVTPRVRYYRQSHASFFAYEFDTPQEFISSDYRLSSFWSWLAGVGFQLKLTDNLSFNMDAGYQKQTGLDRAKAVTALTPVVAPAGGRVTFAEEGEEGGGSPGSLSAADLTTVTATIGFSFRF